MIILIASHSSADFVLVLALRATRPRDIVDGPRCCSVPWDS